MFRSLLEAVRGEASGERALDTIRAITRFHRIQASPGYDAASEWVAAQARALGLEVTVETVPGDGHTRRLGQLMPEGWECRSASAILHGNDRPRRICDFEREPLSIVQRSDSARGRHPLVAVEGGGHARDYDGVDVAGKVVLTSGPVQHAHLLAVVERGAAGLITDGRRLVPPVRTDAHDRDSIAYTSYWWREDEPRGWGFVVSPAEGARLRERLRTGERLELEVAVESRRFTTPIPLLSARLPGDLPGEVLIVSHLCHPQPSANDNASGVAANLETARVLSVLAERGALPAPRLSIRFLWVPELTGTYAWIAGAQGRAASLRAALNLDMVGEDQDACGSTFLLEHPPCFAASFAEELLARIRAEAVDWTTSYSGAGHYSQVRMAEVPYGGGSDHAVFADPAVGVPCPMLIQWPDRYYHSSYDTPDRSDPRSLALAVRCAATYAGVLAGLTDRDRTTLAQWVRRGAERRMLAACDASDPERVVTRERVRAAAAAASLARIGVDEAIRSRITDAIETRIRNEGSSIGTEGPAADSRVPVRTLAAPLHMQRFLIAGWTRLDRAAQDAWREREESTADGLLIGEIAWAACDGRRTIDEIAHLVWLETGHRAPEFVAAFFDWTGSLGETTWAK